MKSQELYRSLVGAQKYLDQIGKQGHSTKGHLHSIKVKTEIYHQPTSGANNYHDHSGFDVALAEAIKDNFEELSKKAISIMREKYRVARIADKASLEAQLKEIQGLELEDEMLEARNL